MYFVWHVVQTPTIILKKPVYKWMACNKQPGVKRRVRKRNNASKQKIKRIRGQSKFVCVAAAPLHRMSISFLDKSGNLQLITFQLLRNSHFLSEHQVSLLCLQESFTCVHAEVNKSKPQSLNIFQVSILILSSYPWLCFSSCFLYLGFPTKRMNSFVISQCAIYPKNLILFNLIFLIFCEEH